MVPRYDAQYEVHDYLASKKQQTKKKPQKDKVSKNRVNKNEA